MRHRAPGESGAAIRVSPCAGTVEAGTRDKPRRRATGNADCGATGTLQTRRFFGRNRPHRPACHDRPRSGMESVWLPQFDREAARNTAVRSHFSSGWNARRCAGCARGLSRAAASGVPQRRAHAQFPSRQQRGNRRGGEQNALCGRHAQPAGHAAALTRNPVGNPAEIRTEPAKKRGEGRNRTDA